MEIPTPSQAVVALATFVRDRLVEVSETIAPLRKPRGDGVEIVTSVGEDTSVVAAARQLATAIVSAAAPFAPSSYSRARLLRQLHASGLLTDDDVYRAYNAAVVLDVEPRDNCTGAPH
ncbi:MAG: hypothetical protein ACR2LX_11515 [Jatrophihabitans sp.]